MLSDSPKVTQLSSREESWSWTMIPTLVVYLSFPLSIAPLYKGDLVKKAVELGQCRGQNETGGCRKQSRLHTHWLWQVTHAGLGPNLPASVDICSSLLQNEAFWVLLLKIFQSSQQISDHHQILCVPTSRAVVGTVQCLWLWVFSFRCQDTSYPSWYFLSTY